MVADVECGAVRDGSALLSSQGKISLRGIVRSERVKMEATKKTRNFVSFSFSLGLSGGAYEWVEGGV